MGMSASQARFLSLTARKTNTEYEGQQINQQRTTLSNESSNYYSQLTSMAVPVPPSSADYSKVTYTFVDGTEVNTITSLVATSDTKSTGIYMLNYAQTIPADTMVVNGTSVVSKTDDKYYIGTDELVPAGDKTYGSEYSKVANPVAADISKYYVMDGYESSSDTKAKYGKTYYADNAGKVKADVNPGDTISGLFEDKFTAAGSTFDKNKIYYTKNETTDADTLKARFIAAGIPANVVNKMSDKELSNKLAVENQYKDLAKEKYGDDSWYVRYVENSNTGSYEAHLFSGAQIENGIDYNEKTTQSLGGVREYVFGQSEETREIKNAQAKVEQDASGRYISLFIYDDDDKTTGRKYDLTTTTEADEAGYNDAMNQYYYDKAIYDQKIQEINAKIEVIQVQDKNLELKLKQLDTEQNAISTELDAVKKVITKNVESSFKTFNA